MMKCFNVYIVHESHDTIKKLCFHFKNFFPLFNIVGYSSFNKGTTEILNLLPDLILLDLELESIENNIKIKELLDNNIIFIGISKDKLNTISALKIGFIDCLDDVNDIEKISFVINKVYTKLIIKKFLLKNNK